MCSNVQATCTRAKLLACCMASALQAQAVLSAACASTHRPCDTAGRGRRLAVHTLSSRTAGSCRLCGVGWLGWRWTQPGCGCVASNPASHTTHAADSGRRLVGSSTHAAPRCWDGLRTHLPARTRAPSRALAAAPTLTCTCTCALSCACNRTANAGGESIYGAPFKDEFHSRLRFSHRGLVACANANAPHTNGSQFFVTLDK